MFYFHILLQLLICCCGAEWIKLPEINLEQVLSDRGNKPEESANNSQDVTEFTIQKDTNNEDVSLSKTSPFADEFSSIFSSRKTSLFDNIFNANDKIFVTKISKLQDKNEDSMKNITISEVPGGNTQKKILNEDVWIRDTKTDEKIRENVKSNGKPDPSSIFKTIDFANVIKTVQQTILANIPNALKGKIEYLKTVHDNILINIDQQIGVIWPRNMKERAKRGVKEDEHHLDFPSAETALMSISFLTFAVFLIKLVMQLINVLKTKKMMTYSPMVTAMGRSPPNITFKPGIPDETTAHILQLMEDFKHY